MSLHDPHYLNWLKKQTPKKLELIIALTVWIFLSPQPPSHLIHPSTFSSSSAKKAITAPDDPLKKKEHGGSQGKSQQQQHWGDISSERATYSSLELCVTDVLPIVAWTHPPWFWANHLASEWFLILRYPAVVRSTLHTWPECFDLHLNASWVHHTSVVEQLELFHLQSGRLHRT